MNTFGGDERTRTVHRGPPIDSCYPPSLFSEFAAVIRWRCALRSLQDILVARNDIVTNSIFESLCLGGRFLYFARGAGLFAWQVGAAHDEEAKSCKKQLNLTNKTFFVYAFLKHLSYSAFSAENHLKSYKLRSIPFSLLPWNVTSRVMRGMFCPPSQNKCSKKRRIDQVRRSMRRSTSAGSLFSEGPYLRSTCSLKYGRPGQTRRTLV